MVPTTTPAIASLRIFRLRVDMNVCLYLNLQWGRHVALPIRPNDLLCAIRLVERTFPILGGVERMTRQFP